MRAVGRLAVSAFRQGRVKEEEACDKLPQLSLPCEVVIPNAEQHLRAQRRSGREHRRLWRVLLGVVRWPAAKCAFCLTLRGCGNAFVLPLLLNYIVEAVVRNDVHHAGCLLAALLAERVCGAVVEYFGVKAACTEIPTTCATALAGLVVDKAAAPGLMGLQKAGVDPSAMVGRELAMLHARAAQSLPNGLIAIPTLAAGIASLFMLLGWPAVFGVAWILFTIRLGIRVQEKAKQAEGKMAVVATTRLGILGNVVSAIKAIKYFAWEPEFLRSLLDKRAEECARLRTRTRWTGLAIGIGKLTPVTSSLVTFVVYAMLGHEVRAGTIFAANTVFMTCRFSVGAISFLSELCKSTALLLSRTEKLLELPERATRSVLPTRCPCLAEVQDLDIVFPGPEDAKEGKEGKEGKQGKDGKEGKEGKEATAEASPKPGFHLSVEGRLQIAQQGKLTAICGHVGSGKSLLLSALLGNVDGDAELSGQTRAVSDVSWCPQKPFVISGSLHENILLGRPFDEEEMARCLADACFASDVEALPNGLEEVVGDRGTTLSGGQQARLGLARAFYGDPALLLLDDPFAAVDAAVGRALLQALRLRVTGAAMDVGRHKSGPPGAVVVLNQLPLLPNFDQIVFIKEGHVVAVGSFEDLTANAEFNAFMQAIELQRRPLDAEQDLLFAQQELLRSRVLSRQLSRMIGSEAGSVTSSALVKKESTATGFVRWAVWRSYFLAPGRFFAFYLLLVYIGMYLTLGIRDWWLTVWADSDAGPDGLYVGLFVAFSMSHVVVVIYAVVLMGTWASRAGQNLHSDCLEHLLRAPMSYFDETPAGRITSRLGPDLAIVDNSMANMIDICLTFSFLALMICITVIVKVPIMSVVFVLAIGLSYPVVVGLATFRQDMKRHSNNAMSPILSNLGEIRRGALLVNTMGCTEFFLARHREHFNHWALLTNACLVTTPISQSWCHFMHLFVLSITGIVTFTQENPSPGLVAMYFSYAALWGLFAMVTMGAIMGLLTNVASLERLLEFKLGGLPQERPWALPSDPAPKAWPSEGAIHFENITLRYRPGLPAALRGLELNIRAGEKLGIVGRTGAGKSSITAVLFRLVECESGRCVIDGVDVATVGLHTLRKAISMIPQEPIVMTGTVRYNLDPFAMHTVEELAGALKTAGLVPTVTLDTPAGGAGAGLSAGQKQLLTFARTLLQNTRIVMMDEPTASVDMQTDRFVQRMTRVVFASRTVLTIAHRLDTVRHCDRLAVLSQGQVVELGSPAELFANPCSELARLSAAEGEGVSSCSPKAVPEAAAVGRGLRGALGQLLTAPRAPAATAAAPPRG